MNFECYVDVDARVCIPINKSYGFIPDLVKDVVIHQGMRNGKKIQAVKMFFTDGKVTVSSPCEGDTFDAETGMIMCILQYIWGGKRYNNFFRKWIKENEKRNAEAKKQEEKKREAREKQRQIEEKAAKRKAARREEKIEIQKEAIIRAMKEYESE